jgi:hypothetical protein
MPDLELATLDDLLDELHRRHEVGLYRGDLLAVIADWLIFLAIREAYGDDEQP